MLRGADPARVFRTSSAWAGATRGELFGLVRLSRLDLPQTREARCQNHVAGWIAPTTRRSRLPRRALNAEDAIRREAGRCSSEKLLEKWDLTSLRIKAPFLEMEWEPKDEDKTAAWELYVELITRAATQHLDPESGRRGGGAGEHPRPVRADPRHDQAQRALLHQLHPDRRRRAQPEGPAVRLAVASAHAPGPARRGGPKGAASGASCTSCRPICATIRGCSPTSRR